MQASRSGDFARPGEGDARSKVLAAVDIVQLIGQSVALKRRGKDYVGLCPFHQEKTPSFHVDPGKQVFYCYGCKAGGTAFDFVMKRDRVEFKEAMVSLADQYGIELPRFGAGKQSAGERQMLLDAQSAACGFFENLLKSPAGKSGREYLTSRGFNDASIASFQIGQAADAWDALSKSPAMRKFPPGILSLGGLLKPRTNGEGFYDTFRNRLMFPIRDENGRVIAFGGRVLSGSQDPAKYLNSPETPLFSKSKSLFGIDLARKRIVETRTVAVVEGYTDVVMAHQFGCTNVVAALGTALTEQHIALLRRFADRVVLLFDADEAGDTAVDRAVELFLTQPIEIAIAGMPDGLDPDEFLLKEGQAAFDALLAGASDALAYKWKQLNRQFADASDDLTGKTKAVETYLGTLAAARQAGPVDSIRWGSALARVSRLTDIPMEELNKRFKASKTIRKSIMAPQPEAAWSPQVTTPVKPRGPLSATDRAERWLLGIVLNEPFRWQSVQQSVHSSDFSTPDRRQLAERFWDHQRHEGATVLQEFLADVNEAELTELAVELSMEASELDDAEGTLTAALEHFASERERQAGRKLVADLRRSTEASPATLSDDDEIELLRKLSAHAGKADMKRI